jgi:hypothetical protein
MYYLAITVQTWTVQLVTKSSQLCRCLMMLIYPELHSRVHVWKSKDSVVSNFCEVVNSILQFPYTNSA